MKLSKKFLYGVSIFYIALGVSTPIALMGFFPLGYLGITAAQLGLGPIRFMDLGSGLFLPGESVVNVLWLSLVALLGGIFGIIALREKSRKWMWVWYAIIGVAALCVVDNAFYRGYYNLVGNRYSDISWSWSYIQRILWVTVPLLVQTILMIFAIRRVRK